MRACPSQCVRLKRPQMFIKTFTSLFRNKFRVEETPFLFICLFFRLEIYFVQGSGIFFNCENFAMKFYCHICIFLQFSIFPFVTINNVCPKTIE